MELLTTNNTKLPNIRLKIIEEMLAKLSVGGARFSPVF